MVSVIIPTYNRAATLERCLGSLEQQTFPAIEIIVVDDGSTDDTPALVARLANSLRLNLRYFHQPNRGCAAARNTGLRESRTELLLFLDSDDALEPQAIAGLVMELNRSGADFVYSPAIEVYPDGAEKLNNPVAAGHPEHFAVEHFLNPNVRNGAVMFRRRLLDRVGLVDESMRYNEDSDFVQRYALLGIAAYSSAPTVRHHHHAGNKSGNRVRIYEALLASCERILAANPDFCARLGERAAVRLNEVRRLLLESLILSGDFAAAAALAPRVNPLPWEHRRAIDWEMRAPVLLAQALRRGLAALQSRLPRDSHS
jgi:glycosyltransferase involved in cell wall biosynthesis